MTNKNELRALTTLRSLELTRDMETKHLKKLAALAHENTFERGEVIYAKGSLGRALYLILDGEIVIETDVPSHGRVVMNRLGPGQFFGWSSLFPPERKMAYTTATKPTRVLAINAAQLRAAFETDHNLEFAIVRCAGKDMADRIRASRQQLNDMISSPAY
ncbi:MAG: Crp/Fnr family transcriptional regulator [Anaerolineae bacterium]|nr:Crp/Fnr family transcriptional regulator [Anaerolineae bacterium]